MKIFAVASLFAAVVAAPAALACGGHGATAAAPATEVVAANTDKAAPAQKSDVVTPKADEKALTLVSVDDVAKQLDAKKKDPKVAFAIFDANGDATRKKEGVIPTAVLLSSSSEYDLALLPKDKATSVVFYCANEKCMASHGAAKRAIGAGYTNVAVLGAGISGWVKAGQAVDKPVG